MASRSNPPPPPPRATIGSFISTSTPPSMSGSSLNDIDGDDTLVSDNDSILAMARRLDDASVISDPSIIEGTRPTPDLSAPLGGRGEGRGGGTGRTASPRGTVREGPGPGQHRERERGGERQQQQRRQLELELVGRVVREGSQEGTAARRTRPAKRQGRRREEGRGDQAGEAGEPRRGRRRLRPARRGVQRGVLEEGQRRRVRQSPGEGTGHARSDGGGQAGRVEAGEGTEEAEAPDRGHTPGGPRAGRRDLRGRRGGEGGEGRGAAVRRLVGGEDRREPAHVLPQLDGGVLLPDRRVRSASHEGVRGIRHVRDAGERPGGTDKLPRGDAVRLEAADVHAERERGVRDQGERELSVRADGPGGAGQGDR
ncbi:hypothetical protein THAOC_13621 [Thalassiosira oceanica]|uniref:Uncharacterized protein n=1 Tax=Thalassiosira oceanica TaxID=159749 RepID=K0SKL6_THAOC|nr:hypothetical protein THAOC_13621 [Thalassiosira oceanica]|eukprot:EJK65504.1 hypothetical protein THAOC_13621 [Thalassiosira oceanica]